MAYEATKEHKGKKYSGMRVGGVHRWTYPDGVWNERKRTPNTWDFAFASDKRRRAKAPKGSGAATGSEYHWYITAHQWVRKVDANTYETFMGGQKHLVAFRKPDWDVFNTQFRNQPSAKQKVLDILEETIDRLRAEDSVEWPSDAEPFVELGTMGREEDEAGQILKVLMEAAGRSDGSLESRTKQELYEKAQAKDVEGRSKMTKRELVEALRQS